MEVNKNDQTLFKQPNKYLQNQISLSRSPPHEKMELQEIQKSTNLYDKLKSWVPNIQFGDFEEINVQNKSLVPNIQFGDFGEIHVQKTSKYLSDLILRSKEGGKIGKVILKVFINMMRIIICSLNFFGLISYSIKKKKKTNI